MSGCWKLAMEKNVKYVTGHLHLLDGRQELKVGTKKLWYVRLVLSLKIPAKHVFLTSISDCRSNLEISCWKMKRWKFLVRWATVNFGSKKLMLVSMNLSYLMIMPNWTFFRNCRDWNRITKGMKHMFVHFIWKESV